MSGFQVYGPHVLPQELAPEDQLERLWGRVLDQRYETLPTAWPRRDHLKHEGTPDVLRAVYLRPDDWEPTPRRRLIHTFGACALVRIEIDDTPETKGLTGMLRAGTSSVALLRYSVVNGDSGTRIPPIPGIGLKAPVHRGSSLNLLFSTGYYRGVAATNALDRARVFATRIRDPRSPAVDFAPRDDRGAAAGLAHRFDDAIRSLQGPRNQGSMAIPLDEICCRDTLGAWFVPERVPDALQIRHTSQVEAAYRSAKGTLRERLLEAFATSPADPTAPIAFLARNLPVWATLHVQDDPDTPQDPGTAIGRLLRLTPFVASRFADDHLLFRHATWMPRGQGDASPTATARRTTRTPTARARREEPGPGDEDATDDAVQVAVLMPPCPRPEVAIVVAARLDDLPGLDGTPAYPPRAAIDDPAGRDPRFEAVLGTSFILRDQVEKAEDGSGLALAGRRVARTTVALPAKDGWARPEDILADADRLRTQYYSASEPVESWFLGAHPEAASTLSWSGAKLPKDARALLEGAVFIALYDLLTARPRQVALLVRNTNATATLDTRVDLFWNYRADGSFRRKPRGEEAGRAMHLRVVDDAALHLKRGDDAIDHFWLPYFMLTSARASAPDNPESYDGFDPTDKVDEADKLLWGDEPTVTWMDAILDYADEESIGRHRLAPQWRLNNVCPRVYAAGSSQIERIVTEAHQNWAARNDPSEGRFDATWSTSSEHLVDRLLQGIAPVPPRWIPPDEATGRPGHLRIDFAWKPPLDDTGPYGGALPDLQVVLSSGGTVAPRWNDGVNHGSHTPILDGKPALLAIRVRYPGATEFTELTPDSHESDDPAARDAWSHAKRLVRQAMLVSGQIDWHVARAHFWIEGVCVALMRSSYAHVGFRDAVSAASHRVFSTLWPFVRSADQINAWGDVLLFSEKGILARTTGLGAAAVKARVRTQMGAVTWKGFTPRRPLWPGDLQAHRAQVAWNAAKSYAASQVPTNVSQDFLDALSCELVHEGPAFEPFMKDATVDDTGAWLCEWSATTLAVAGSDRVTRPDGSVAAIHPIRDRDDLVAFVAFVVYTATFFHSRIGQAQFEDGGHPLLAPLGLQYRPTRPDGSAWAPDDGTWDDYGPVAAHVGFQAALAELLARFPFGVLSKERARTNPTYPQTRPAFGGYETYAITLEAAQTGAVADGHLPVDEPSLASQMLARILI